MSRAWFFAAPLLLLGVFLRFHALDRQSLWDDEMSTLRTISTPRAYVLDRFATYETHPPLYFLQLKIWRALHLRSLVKLRANSALWGSLGLLLIYFLARFYGGEPAGFFALAFLTLSPFHLAYSQEMRCYAMAVTEGMFGLLILEKCIAGPPPSPSPSRGEGIRVGVWLLLTLTWVALLYTHYWGTFVVLAQAVYGLYASRSSLDKKAVLTAAGAAGILFTPWLPLLRAQLGVASGLTFWVSAFSITNLAKAFVAYTGLLFNMASWTFYLPTHVWVLGVMGLSFAVALGKGIQKGPKAAVIWLGVGLSVPWILSIWKPVIFVWYRYPIHMLPAFVLLIASGVTAVRRPTSDAKVRTSDVARRTLLAVVLLGSQAWGSWTYFHGWQKANPKAVVQYVHWLIKPNTVVVRPFYFADLYSFYDQGTTTSMDEHLLDSPEKRAALKGKNVILIAFDVPSDPVADALLSEFKPVSARYFPGTAHLGITVYQLK